MAIDTSNMGHIEGQVYTTLDAMGVKMTGKLRRLEVPLDTGAVKEWVLNYTMPDGRQLTKTVPWDYNAFPVVVQFAKDNL